VLRPIVSVNRTDSFLLPEVVVTVSIPGTLPGVRLALGEVTAVAPDKDRLSVHVRLGRGNLIFRDTAGFTTWRWSSTPH
jgi:hypothetical protein